ncbi:Phage protein [Pseudomonas sp. R4-39-08]|nr:Phage protein [Pseudomonas sp. R4-39-08]
MIPIKERPILFLAPMVRAILEGRKTVTRRAVKASKAHADGITLIKFTLILLGALLYLVASDCWFTWTGLDLLETGSTDALIYAFAGTCAWLLITFGLAVHIIKTALPTGSFDQPEA